jgi:uncharacterized protein (DUF58 family)
MTLPRPTVLGIKAMAFYGGLVLAFFAAPYANLFFLLLVFLTVTGGSSVWWAWGVLRRVTRVTWYGAPMPAGAGGFLRLDVEGDVNAPGLALDLRFEEGPSLRIPCILEEGSLAPLRIPPLPRGVHVVRRASLSTAWPFGLFQACIQATGPASLVVYPAPADLVAWRGGAGGRGDRPGGLGDAQEMQPSSLREYREGDELRRIHWRASARRRVPVVKEYEGRGTVGHEVVLDMRLPRDEFEAALSLVTALALEIRDAKGSLLLHAQGGSLQYGAHGAPWYDLLRFLAAAQPLSAGGPPPPAASPSIVRIGGGVRP